MPLIIISVLVQVALVVHIIKTGRNTTWIWVVAMLPLAGTLAYLIIEVLPSLSNSQKGRETSRKIRAVVNPNQDFNKAASDYQISDTVENSMNLANECLQKGRYKEAKSLFEKCLSGPHQHDPDLMVGLATACFYLEEFEKAQTILQDIKTHNPNYNNSSAHLLYARTLEAQSDIAAALHEYEALHEYYPGPDADYYFVQCLISNEQKEAALTIAEQQLLKADSAGKLYQKMHKQMLTRIKHLSSSI